MKNIKEEDAFKDSKHTNNKGKILKIEEIKFLKIEPQTSIKETE